MPSHPNRHSRLHRRFADCNLFRDVSNSPQNGIGNYVGLYVYTSIHIRIDELYVYIVEFTHISIYIYIYIRVYMTPHLARTPPPRAPRFAHGYFPPLGLVVGAPDFDPAGAWPPVWGFL